MRMNWWDITVELQDPFNYDEFVRACLVKEFSPMPIYEYAQKVGMLMVAMRCFKGVSPEAAYMAFIQEMNNAYSQRTNTSSKGGCGSCGKKS